MAKRFTVCEVRTINSDWEGPSYCAKGVWTLEQFNEALCSEGVRATQIHVKHTRIKHDLSEEYDTVWTVEDPPRRGAFLCTWANPDDIWEARDGK